MVSFIFGFISHFGIILFWCLIGYASNWGKTTSGDALGGAVLGYGFFILMPSFIFSLMFDLVILWNLLKKKIQKELGVIYFLWAFFTYTVLVFGAYNEKFLLYILKGVCIPNL